MFKIVKSEPENEAVSLTVEQKKLLTELYLSTKGDATKTKHKMGKLRVKTSLITQSFNIKKAIFEHVKKIMRGEVIVKEEESHLDEAGNKIIDKEAVYNTVPGTKTKLIEEAYKEFPDCDMTAFTYNIDMIIKWSDGTGNNTFDNFKNIFK